MKVRSRTIYHADGTKTEVIVDGKIVAEVPQRESGLPYVMGDIQPYQSMITGEMIQGRRQHREHLRQHGCIEVGNEKLTPSAPPKPSREKLKQAVHESMQRLGY